MQSIIMHIDMNSYFATCEQQDNPAWRGKPLGVCEHLGGIIIAASIEAKRYGIKTGTPVWEAKRLYPKIILVPTTPNRYRYYTGRFLKVVEDYTNFVEKYSIDEVFLDVTRTCNIRVSSVCHSRTCLPAGRAAPAVILSEVEGSMSFGSQIKSGMTQESLIDPFVEAERMALEIKQRIRLEVGDYLSCSVGIASNKLLAKIASDMQKPDGLVVVRPEDKYKLYDQLKLIDIPGIGVRMERNLNKLGIYSLKDLRDYPKTKLVAQFGIPGHHLYQMGQLEGSWKENFSEEPLKSIGHMYTVTKEYRKASTFEPLLYKLSEMVATRLRVNKLSGNVLSVHMHDAKRNCAGASKRLSYQLSDGRDIFLESRAIFRKGAQSLQNFEVYLIGVTVASLTPEVDQPSLFAAENNKLAVKALDKINEKYGDFTVARVPAFQARDIIRDSVGFGRMKEFKTTPARTNFGH